eukprot:6880-Pelagococcus_subviridis.AAC.5
MEEAHVARAEEPDVFRPSRLDRDELLEVVQIAAAHVRVQRALEDRGGVPFHHGLRLGQEPVVAAAAGEEVRARSSRPRERVRDVVRTARRRRALLVKPRVRADQRSRGSAKRDRTRPRARECFSTSPRGSPRTRERARRARGRRHGGRSDRRPRR